MRRPTICPSYSIDEVGNVFRNGSDVPLKAVEAKRGGYLQVSLWENGKGKTYYVHQLIALAFHGPRPSPRHHAAHRDGNKRNNTPINVEWITKEENEADKIKHGRSNRGERNGSAKITDAQAAEILIRAKALARSSGGVRFKKGTLPTLAAEYGISANAVAQIIAGRRRSAA